MEWLLGLYIRRAATARGWQPPRFAAPGGGRRRFSGGGELAQVADGDRLRWYQVQRFFSPLFSAPGFLDWWVVMNGYRCYVRTVASKGEEKAKGLAEGRVSITRVNIGG